MSSKKSAAGGKSSFQSPARSGFGGFGGFTTTSSTLSYISEPPDLTAVSDSNVVVSLKNLLKKDSTTKAKALDDFLVYIQEHPYEKDGGVEEAVLDAWVSLYGRTSIDNARRVRELCHTVQFELMKSARKRMEKRLPKIAGPWLAGTYDKDRVVSKAANDGLSSFLNTDEKVTQFWQRLQSQILDYALESVRETPDTLSDERSTNKEDSEAKYYRVVGASLALVLNLLQKIGVYQSLDQLDEYLGAESVWALAAAEDSHVRRMVYQLALTCLQEHDDLLKSHLPRLGKALVSDALKIKQTGSALDYVRVLTVLTTKHPEVWGTKKHPFSRLQSLVEKGSQGSSSDFWQELRQLTAALAQDTLSLDVAKGFLKALRTGISSREEPRANAPYAWACYFESFLLFLDKLPSEPEESRLDFIKDTFFPVTEQYLHPVAEKSSWNTAAPLSLLPKAWATLTATKSDRQWRLVYGEWKRLGEELVSRMNSSLPEVSKEFQNSQQSIADEGERWFALAGAIDKYITKNYGEARRMKKLVGESSGSVSREAVELLIRRNFKPFGAASIVESALKRYQAGFEESSPYFMDILYTSNEPDRLKILLGSSSAPYLLSALNILESMGHGDAYEDVWDEIVNILLETKEEYVPARLAVLISTEKGKTLALKHQALQDYLVSNSLEAAKGSNANWDLIEAALATEALSDASLQSLAADIVRAIKAPHGLTRDEVTEETSLALKALEVILKHKPALFASASGSELHKDVLTKLLALAEISDETVSERVAALRTLLDKHVDGVSPLVEIVQKNLDNENPRACLDVDTLVEQAKILLANGASLEQLVPNTNIWMNELNTALDDAAFRDAPLSSSLGAAYSFLVGHDRRAMSGISKDIKGRSVPVRMAVYTTKLLVSGRDLLSLPAKLQSELLYLLCLVVEMSEDELVTEANGREGSLLWHYSRYRDSDVNGIHDFISSARRRLTDVISAADLPDGKIVGGSLVGDLIALMLEQTRGKSYSGKSALALYSAKALASVLETLVEAHSLPSSVEDTLTQLGLLKVDLDTFYGALAFLTGLGETLASSKAVKLFCNRLISDVAGAEPGNEKTEMTVALLNACLSVYGSGELPVDNRRQVFAVRQITSWLQNPTNIGSDLANEACKALIRLFPNVASVYGPYWEQAIQFCLGLWNDGKAGSGTREACIHSSLKLSATLESLKGANDDLDDALAAYAEAKSLALLHLLKERADRPKRHSDIVDALLCRQVAKIPLDHVKDLSDLYGLVASESREIQTAGFGILSKAIAAAQSQISVDVLLEKRDAKLPDELLSLLLDAPQAWRYSTGFPTPIRSYLLSWRLVFSAFPTAASKVRNDYGEQLKASNSLAPLMELMFELLGHSDARPLNLDRAGFTTEHMRAYDITTADGEPDERSMEWLLIHLFYLTLKYLPGLFKAWFLDCRSKQTKVAVEGWMTKYFSPLIISENLDEVTEWAATQEPPEEDEKELVVKVSRAAREILAGYEVDELQASIAIRVPPSYPIEPVVVTGINRVAVSEKKWQSWLMITQGVITLGNGSIIDGLTTFRRNVVGALKGQTECAICYSIISADKKMPDKKCGTCRNAFHRTCLYKWFQTSHQNTCPLCRNPIEYLGSDTRRDRWRGMELD